MYNLGPILQVTRPAVARRLVRAAPLPNSDATSNLGDL
jgi:hypothetical protein